MMIARTPSRFREYDMTSVTENKPPQTPTWNSSGRRSNSSSRNNGAFSGTASDGRRRQQQTMLVKERMVVKCETPNRARDCYLIKEPLRVQPKTASQTRFASAPRKPCKSKYLDFPSPPLRIPVNRNPGTPSPNLPVRRRRKLNRLLAKMEYIYFLTNSGVNERTFYYKPRPRLDTTAPITPSHSTSFTHTKRKPLKPLPPPHLQYTDETLEKLVNNDIAHYRNSSLSAKEELILSSMRSTFLCSNYLRFQPLLNIFE